MDKKYTFSIPVEWTVCANVDIEASSHEEAMELARDADLPEDGEYVDSSFEINIECSESQNCSVIEVIKVDQTSLKDLPKLLFPPVPLSGISLDAFPTPSGDVVSLSVTLALFCVK